MLELKKKDLERSNWGRVIKKEFIVQTYQYDMFEGVIGIIKIIDVESPLMVHYKSKSIVIADRNYIWVQFAPKNCNWWLTAMFDHNHSLLECYFDITKENIFDNELNPYFIDMFLDVVLFPNGNTVVIDEDELAQALDQKIIFQDDYDLAITTASQIITYCKRHYKNIIRELEKIIDLSNFTN